MAIRVRVGSSFLRWVVKASLMTYSRTFQEVTCFVAYSVFFGVSPNHRILRGFGPGGRCLDRRRVDFSHLVHSLRGSAERCRGSAPRVCKSLVCKETIGFFRVFRVVWIALCCAVFWCDFGSFPGCTSKILDEDTRPWEARDAPPTMQGTHACTCRTTCRQ